jgi:hypothetical protein
MILLKKEFFSFIFGVFLVLLNEYIEKSLIEFLHLIGSFYSLSNLDKRYIFTS